MNTITEMIPFIVPETPSATEAIISMRLREAVRIFCRETESWRIKVEIDRVDEQADYDVTILYDAYIKRILSIKNRTSTTQSFDSITGMNLNQYRLNDEYTGFSFLSGYEPKNDLSTGIEIEMVLMPETNCEELSGNLLDRYYEGIVSKAKALLMRTPQTPYFNPDLSQFYERDYIVCVANAIRENQIKFRNSNLQIKQLGNIL